jgi:hypothetical protein
MQLCSSHPDHAQLGSTLETAVNGRADAIVTFNLPDYGAVPGRFNIEALTPATAIRRSRNE